MTCEIISITDADTGTTARLLPAVGMNCFQLQVQTSSGPIDVIWSESGFEQGDKRATGSGIPLLFPFPGRIAGTTLTWDGRPYLLEPGDGQGNAIHGFVHERAWRVLQHTPSRVVAAFQASIDDPSLLERWPADFRILTTYEVCGHCLSASYLLENPDDHSLPCGFGTHPYFRVPLGGASADACRVQLPVSSSWELVEMNATGRKQPLDDAQTFHQGQSFGAMTLDNVFSDLVFTSGHCQAKIHDVEAGQATVMTFDRAFRECVVYTPPHREAICIEPYTCVPDPFRLERQGISAGLRYSPQATPSRPASRFRSNEPVRHVRDASDGGA